MRFGSTASQITTAAISIVLSILRPATAESSKNLCRLHRRRWVRRDQSCRDSRHKVPPALSWLQRLDEAIKFRRSRQNMRAYGLDRIAHDDVRDVKYIVE